MAPALIGWPGVAITNVDVTLPVAGKDLDLHCNKLTFRTGIASLIPPRPSVSLTMKGLRKGGDLYVKYKDHPDHTGLVVEAEGVLLDQLSIPGLSESLSGKLDLDADLSLEMSDFAKSTGDIDLTIAQLKIPGQNIEGLVLPPLNMGNAKAKLIAKNGVVEINSVQFGDQTSDLKGSLTGDMKLGAELRRSFLNLTLRVQFSEKYKQDPKSQMLLSILESFRSASRGDYGMRWSATLDAMGTNIMSAIPQKVE
ncbi:MAG: type II secretion system protein GspN, partial [Deltaproteobacteria bacterium]|nr:type II secretion system protein GspN [Deltaproteobacteria bacterium]